MKKIILGVVIIILITLVYFWYNQKTSHDMPETATLATTTGKIVATSTAASTSTTKPETVVFNLDSGAFYFKPNVLRVKVGQPVIL